LSLPFIGVILAANRFGRVLVNPFVGSAVDRLGAKRVLVVGLVTQSLVLGLYLVGVATGHPGALFLIGRLVHGPSSSCVFIAAQTLALHAGGREHKGLTSGIVRSSMAAGMPVGLVLGGLLAGWIGPAAAFGVAMVAPIMAVCVAAFTVPDLRATAQRVPTLREVLRSLRNRAVGAIAAINFVSTFCALGVILTTLVLIIHERSIRVGHLSDQTSAGVFMGFLVVFMILVTPLAGRLSDRHGWRAHVVMAGVAAMVPGVLLIGIATSAVTLATGLALIGLGMGTLTSPLLALLGDLVPSEMRGSAIGCLQLFGDAGGTLGPIVGTSMLGGTGALPYVATAALLALTLPLGGWLAAAERAHGR
jgi:MFS family permease